MSMSRRRSGSVFYRLVILNPEDDEVKMPIFWRNPDGWVFRLAYRVWITKSDE